MSNALDRYKKISGTGPGSTIGLEDWNGLLDELGNTLAGLTKKGADFDAISAVAIGVLLDRINEVLGPAYDRVIQRQAEVDAKVAQLTSSGVSATAVLETSGRVFVSPAQRTAIETHSQQLSAITAGSDPLFDTFAEVAVRLATDATDLAGILAALANRLRFDAPQSLTSTQIAQALANLSIASSLVPAGTAGFFYASAAPAGWLKANGAQVSRTSYAALFAAIGTTFGSGNGSTTFQLPDARGEFLRGWDDGRGVDGGRSLGSSQTDQLSFHSHQTPFGLDTNGQVTAWVGAGGYGFYGYDTITGAGAQVIVPDYFQGRTIYNARTGGPIAVAGETRPRNLAPLACIKF